MSYRYTRKLSHVQTTASAFFSVWAGADLGGGFSGPLRWPAAFKYNWYSANSLWCIGFWRKTKNDADEDMLKALKMVVLARHVTIQLRHSLVVQPLLRKILDQPLLRIPCLHVTQALVFLCCSWTSTLSRSNEMSLRPLLSVSWHLSQNIQVFPHLLNCSSAH